jgi:hypothetical protein
VNNRPIALVLIAVALAGYGVYIGSYLPGMLLFGPSLLLLLVCFVLQAVCALAAAIGVWRDQPWAAGLVVALGLAVAATSLVEAFVLGIVAYLHAALVAVAAIVTVAIIAAYLKRRRPRLYSPRRVS